MANMNTAQARPAVRPPPPAPPSFDALFTKATETKSPIKALLYGLHGTQKTRKALTFPSPAVIDVEGLAQIYARDFPGAYFTQATNLEAVKLALASIIQDGGRTVKTVVIDSLTALYDQRKAYYLDKYGYLGQVQRERIKIDMKGIYNLVAACPINVVLIAREANVYEESKGNDDKVKVVGVRIDADNSAPYIPNFVVHMTGGGAGILEKVQGLAITDSKVKDASWDGFFADIAKRIESGDDPNDIRRGAGKALWLAHWKSEGLTTGQIAKALGVASSEDWTKGRAAADEAITEYAVKQGWIPDPNAKAPDETPASTGNDPEPTHAYDLGAIFMEIGDLFDSQDHITKTIKELRRQEMVDDDTNTDAMISALRAHVGQ